MGKNYWLTGLLTIFLSSLHAQYGEWNTGWKCQAIGKVHAEGSRVSRPDFSTKGWLTATVPGTVLTTLINNHLEPDPFYGMNNRQIPDIYTAGRDYYTYWFVKDFRDSGAYGRSNFEKAREQVWLNFDGVNYSCDIWLNGHRLNTSRHYGMFLRQTYNITRWLNRNGNNRLAVIVYPPDPVGNPNGGQGGDGEIARSVTHQYVAGWDWIQPVADRNTGIWDKVWMDVTRPIRITNPHVVTLVPGIRYPDDSDQAPAVLRITAEVENPDTIPIRGNVYFSLSDSNIIRGSVESLTLAPGERKQVTIPDITITHPKLWWPNGYGDQALYHGRISFAVEDTVNPGEREKIYQDIAVIPLDFGIRQLTTSWNPVTGSRQLEVNGQKIFIKGGNWIVSDELLRLSPGRYDAEIRFHRDMNLNLIRVWGGALTERPEFYDACDKYGLLVFQDFWNSGDCNGRWEDPKKKEDQWTRRKYPDDHALFIGSAADQIRLLRNHPSLAFWCGGNEITPPEDIFHALKDSLMPLLDGTRYFFDYSNSDSMSRNTLGGNGDGPYGLEDIRTFWARRTFPFNSEVGSVGMGDYESLERFIPKEDLVPPSYPGKGGKGEEGLDPVWKYHKYIGYDSAVYAYGPVKDLRDFAEKAQLVNYDQYRALAEGFSSHMWEWYTGAIIWKTQNPWTALRGQMYDCYLDVNAGLYGLHTGSEPLHIMYDPVRGMTMIANNGFRTRRDLMMQVRVFDMDGKVTSLGQQFFEVGPTTSKSYLPIGRHIDALRRKEGLFLSLRLLDTARRVVSDNFYWLPDSAGVYSGLQRLGVAALTAETHRVLSSEPGKERLQVILHNPPGGPVAFFIRLSLLDPVTHLRLLPVFYSDNYLSIPPGESRTVTLEWNSKPHGPAYAPTPLLSVQGWNVPVKTWPVN
ncbi:MAG TPA: glycoside hydrolase family 2 TIM barrel-domain containing protein [Puia sp.]|nr:glycoside hydrolase family 2 TIM barrel-domain containing protein [Puia sp.]